MHSEGRRAVEEASRRKPARTGAAAQAGGRAEYTTAVRIAEGPDGWYVATAPALPGCISQGETRAQARENLEAVSLYVEHFLESGEALPPGLASASGAAAVSVRGKNASARIAIAQEPAPARGGQASRDRARSNRAG